MGSLLTPLLLHSVLNTFFYYGTPESFALDQPVSTNALYLCNMGLNNLCSGCSALCKVQVTDPATPD